MPSFIYRAKGGHGTITGELEAESLRGALAQLDRQGYIPLHLEERRLKKGKGLSYWRAAKHSHRELALIARGLSQLLSSGLPLMESLQLLRNQTNQKSLHLKLEQMQKTVSSGGSLEAALQQIPSLSLPVAVNVIRAGEVSGTLDKVLKDLAVMLEEELEMRAKIRAALHYPLFMLVVGMGSIALLMNFVIPKIVVLFQDLGQQLPWLTQTLITCSQWWNHNWIFLVTAGAIGWFPLRGWWHQPYLKALGDRISLRVPVFGRLVIQRNFARWSYSLAHLLKSGIPAVEALQTACLVMGNTVLQKQMAQVTEGVRQGKSLKEGLTSWQKDFPTLTALIAVGEESGQLEQNLKQASDQLQLEVERLIKGIVNLLEPVLILLLGLVVGVIVIAMLLPIFELNLGA